ncbi:MAG TPA: hypothetical protein VNE22_02480 [Acidimicrobiales bacterium]|nr:hypothetical protein [Acidimicrobiales bacterium]
MTPTSRTPQQRDRRFARTRRITQGLLLGSGVASGLLVTIIASGAKPYTTTPVTVPSTTNSGTSTTPSPSVTTPSPSVTTPSPSAATPSATPTTTVYTPPAPAPVTTTTTCYSTPSGTVTCY